jgi:transcriptional regulator with XRE-family HTH domain
MERHLREYRKAAGYTLEEVCSRVRCTPSYLSKLERGQRRLYADMLEDLALIYQTHPAKLVTFPGAAPGQCPCQAAPAEEVPDA